MSTPGDSRPDSGATERLGPGTVTWEADSASHVSRYLFAVDFSRGKRVLDAGSGLGYGSAVLKTLAAKEVVGVDIDEDSVTSARSSYPLDGLLFLQDDCETLSNVLGPFDVVCNFENIEHLHRPARFLEAAARLLAEDGVLLCSTPDRAGSTWEHGRPKNPYHVNEWYRDEFAAMLSKSFEEVEIRAQVESLAYKQRHDSMIRLNEHLFRLWMAPTVRLGRLAKRLTGGRPKYPDLGGFGAASPADFPIVPYEIATILGRAICHVAVCRAPRS